MKVGQISSIHRQKKILPTQKKCTMQLKGDVSKLDNFISPDFVDHSGGAGDIEIRGKDSLKAKVGDLHNHVKDLKFNLIASATSDDGAYNFTLVQLTGTSIDDFMGVPPNTTIDQTAVNVISIKDGMFTGQWRFIKHAKQCR